MKKFLSIVGGLFLVLFLAVATGQDLPSPLHQQTSPIVGARYDVLQSALTARLTFRLDRFSGRVWQLVKTKDDDNKWEETWRKQFTRPEGHKEN